MKLGRPYVVSTLHHLISGIERFILRENMKSMQYRVQY